MRHAFAIAVPFAAFCLTLGGTEIRAEEESEVVARGASVFANARRIHTKTTSGKTIILPDVCLTPSAFVPNQVPIPYPVVGANASDLKKGRHKIKGGGEIVLKASKLSASAGDEAGVVKGVASKQAMKARFVAYSADVKFEGQNVVRMLDTVLHNAKGVEARADRTPTKVITEGYTTLELEDGTFCAVCLRNRAISAIYTLQRP